MSALKIFFHDNCFDGAASAAVFASFYRQCIDSAAAITLQGVQHQADPFGGHTFVDGDNACVDFRYSADPRMTWWFDHHVSAFQPPELRTHFEADSGGQKFYDPTAKSNTKFEADSLVATRGYEIPEGFAELIHWAEIIDGAQFPDAKMAVELKEPALLLMTWLEQNHDPSLTHRYIDMLGTRSLAEIAAERWVADPLQPLLERHQRNIELIRTHSRLDTEVVFFDLTGQDVPAFNKFISYFLYPSATYTVGLIQNASRVKISVGSNPWAPERRTHNIAAICERYGGGGHPVVGAVSLKPDQIERGREIAREICAALMS